MSFFRKFTAYHSLPRREDLPSHNATLDVSPRVLGRVFKEDYLVCGYCDGLYKLSTIRHHVKFCQLSAEQTAHYEDQAKQADQKRKDDSIATDRKYFKTDAGKRETATADEKSPCVLSAEHTDKAQPGTKVRAVEKSTSGEGTKFCIFCGNEVPSIARYCSVCGELQ